MLRSFGLYKRSLNHTPPKFNSSPLKSYLSNRKVVFQPPFFRGYVKLGGRVLNHPKKKGHSELPGWLHFLPKTISLEGFSGKLIQIEQTICVSVKIGDSIGDFIYRIGIICYKQMINSERNPSLRASQPEFQGFQVDSSYLFFFARFCEEHW